MENRRLQFIDIARGIGMICIILGHIGNDTIDRIVYTFHVPLFFLIAGYFINEKRSIKDFIKNRARMLLIPYAVTCAVMIVIATAEGIMMYGSVGAWQGINWVWAAFYGSGNSIHIQFFIKSIGAIWFLLALFWGSVLFRCLLKINKWIRPFLLAALFAAAVLTRELFWLPFSLQPGICAASFLYIGWLVHKYSYFLGKIPMWLRYAAAALAAIVWGIFIYTYERFWFVRCDFARGVPEILMCLCACAFVIFLSWLLSKVPILGSFLSWIGRISLMVLCVHNIELNLFPWNRLMGFLILHGMPSSIEIPVIAILKIAADLIFAWLLLKIRPVRKLFGYQ